jgi:hypothetical protein
MAHVRTDVSKERSASIIRVETESVDLCDVLQLVVTAYVVPSSLILSTLKMGAIRSSKMPVTSQKTAFYNYNTDYNNFRKIDNTG